MTVRLRPHHLLCLLTYVGEGYNPVFTANLAAVARRLAAGEDILVAEGPDDICAPLLCHSGPHCFFASVTERDRLAARDIGVLLKRPMRAGERLAPDPEFLATMRQAFADGRIRASCAGCQWSLLCDSVAAGGYDGAVFAL